MSGILVISICVRLLAIGWSLVLIRRLREWRMGFLTVMLTFMAIRQILTLWSTSRSSAEPVLSAASEFPGLVVSFMALAAVHAVQRVFEKQRRDEERRRNLESQLQHAQRLESLGLLAGSIAHDFNNLLTPVMAHAGMLRERLKDDAVSAEHVQAIEEAAHHAAALCSQMLTFSGRGHQQVEAVNLSQLVETIGQLLEAGIASRVVVDYALADDLPLILADPRQLQQVVMNLITNASDATRESGGLVKIRTGVWNATRDYLADSCVDDDLEPGEYVFLEVSDTGAGMDRGTIARVFDPFFSTKREGRGLGMAAVMGIVRGHRGAIRIDSQPGEGTTIRVLFPVAPSGTVAEAADVGRVSLRGSGRALVVDDTDAVRSAAGQMIEQAGFDVVFASDGREALERVKAFGDGIRFILLDLTMPSVDGREVITRLRETGAMVPVILSSGCHETDVSAILDELSPAEFLQKPYRPEELEGAIERVLNRQEAREDLDMQSVKQRECARPPGPAVGERETARTQVLLIDDQPIIRSSLRALVEAMGLQCLEAEDGPSALQVCKAQHHEIGLILLDQQMPGMPGHEILQELVRRYPEIPVVLCSGSGRSALPEHCRDLVAGELKKPYSLGQLRTLLQQHLGQVLPDPALPADEETPDTHDETRPR